MSVEQQLGLDADGTHRPGCGCYDRTDRSRLLQEATRRWPAWRQRHPVLPELDDVARLRPWVACADPASADAVLAGLAELSCPQGGDDLAATAVLAWLMVPGASRLALQLRGVSARIDELVAAQLWVQARTIGARCRQRVAANILWNTRGEVLRDLGVAGVGATWARTRVVEYPDRLTGTGRDGEGDRDWLTRVDAWPWQGEALGQLTAADESALRLNAVLSRACDQGVITGEERDLLVALAESTHAASRSAARGLGGLTAATATAAVAARQGMSSRTVRRRASAALAAMQSAAAAWTAQPVPEPDTGFAA